MGEATLDSPLSMSEVVNTGERDKHVRHAFINVTERETLRSPLSMLQMVKMGEGTVHTPFSMLQILINTFINVRLHKN